MVSDPVYYYDMLYVSNFVAFVWTKSKTDSLYLYVANPYHVWYVLRLLQEIISEKKDEVIMIQRGSEKSR